MLPGLSLMACSARFLLAPRTTSPEVVSPTTGWTPTHQSLIKKMPPRFAYKPNGGVLFHFVLFQLSFLMTTWPSLGPSWEEITNTVDSQLWLLNLYLHACFILFLKAQSREKNLSPDHNLCTLGYRFVYDPWPFVSITSRFASPRLYLSISMLFLNAVV